MVVHARLTETAYATGPGWRDGDPLTCAETTDFAAHRLNNAGHLMAQGHGLLDADSAKTTVLLVVQIRATNATIGDADQQLLLSQDWGIDNFQAQVLGCVANEGAHRLIL
jgi:hypothetical protein